MSNHSNVTLVKGNIKLTEYDESTFTHHDKIFIQSGCVGFFLTQKELKDLYVVINYYLNTDELEDIKVMVGGEYVAT
jgi:hypothetical protein